MKSYPFNGAEHKVFMLNHTPVILVEEHYINPGTLAVRILAVRGFLEPYMLEPYMPATVNLDGWTGYDTQTDRRAYLDVNNGGDELVRFVEENGLASPTGIRCQSGFVTYPLYEWDTSKFTL